MPVQSVATMRPPAQYAVRRRTNVKLFPAPIGGWIANRSLAIPSGPGLPPGAAVLENWFPTASRVVMRRGSALYATLGLGDEATKSLFSYKNGPQEELFGATDTDIYDITSVDTPFNYMLETDTGDVLVTDTGDTFGQDSTTELAVVTGQTNGDWVVLQFATSGGVYLVLVNGTDPELLYDGTNWYPIGDTPIMALNYDAETVAFVVGGTLTGGTSGATAEILKVIDNGTTGTLWIRDVTGTFQNNETITGSLGGSATSDGVASQLAPGITGIATNLFSYVWSYKNRLFYVEKDSLNAWYLATDAVGGAATKFPLGGIFQRGGSLVFGGTWSLDSGSGGSGLSQQCVFVTSEGEIAVYQGTNPGDANDWSLVGVYRIGKPLGKQAHFRAGGDMAIATDIGLLPLSTAVQRDYAALSPSAISFSIEDAWNAEVQARAGLAEWHCEVWPSAQMVIVTLPTVNERRPTWFVANARTGAWAPFIGWDANCLEIFQNRCFFGSQDGRVVEANITGQDEGVPYTAACSPLFDDLGAPSALKIAEIARAVIRSKGEPREKISILREFDEALPAAPDTAIVNDSSAWNVGVWGEAEGAAVWGEITPLRTSQPWRVVDGHGYVMSPCVQITSGSIVPLDAELIRTELAFETADQIT